MLSIGVDIIKISRMAETLNRSGRVFLNRVFTNTEQQTGKKHHDPAAYYAMTFAAKEAVFKLFGIGWDSGVDLRDIEVRLGSKGEPLLKLSGRFALLSGELANAQISISLSYDGDTAIAVAALVQG